MLQSRMNIVSNICVKLLFWKTIFIDNPSLTNHLQALAQWASECWNVHVHMQYNVEIMYTYNVEITCTYNQVDHDTTFNLSMWRYDVMVS